jgi:hypothetical protein
MPLRGKLLAWIEAGADREFVAAFVGGGATRRLPATRLCASQDEARCWIDQQALSLGLPIEWVAGPPAATL